MSNQESRAGLLHHVELFVSNLERTRDFWSFFLGELGYRVLEEWEGGLSFKKGATFIVFVQVAEKYQEPAYHRSRVGLNHLAFHAESRDQVDVLTEAVREKGMRILYEDRHPHAGGAKHYALFFEDPDRIKVELVAPRKRSQPE